MSTAPSENLNVEIIPVSADRWQDLESLFGPRGAYSGCWCMFWRVKRTDFNKMTGEDRKAALHELTNKNEVPGLLAVIEDQPIGWVSIGPRQAFTALENSRILKRVDDTPVWSIVCFYIAKPFRKKGILSKLLQGAVKYAEKQGAQIVEGYPIDLHTPLLAGQTLHGCSGYMGIASAFTAAGFEKVADASATQRIMRYTVKKTGQPI